MMSSRRAWCRKPTTPLPSSATRTSFLLIARLRLSLLGIGWSSHSAKSLRIEAASSSLAVLTEKSTGITGPNPDGDQGRSAPAPRDKLLIDANRACETVFLAFARFPTIQGKRFPVTLPTGLLPAGAAENQLYLEKPPKLSFFICDAPPSPRRAHRSALGYLTIAVTACLVTTGLSHRWL